MTELTPVVPDGPQEALPIPDLVPARPQGQGAVEAGVVRKLQALRDQDLLTDADAAEIAMALAIARETDALLVGGRGRYALPDLMRTLREILKDLGSAADGVDSKLAEAMRAWEEAPGARPGRTEVPHTS